MNPSERIVPDIAKRLSLREPQRRALEILERVTALVPPRKNGDIETALAALRREFPMVTDFERDFPSLCFAPFTATRRQAIRTRSAGISCCARIASLGVNLFY